MRGVASSMKSGMDEPLGTNSTERSENIDSIMLNDAFELYNANPVDETLEGVYHAGKRLVAYFAKLYGRGYSKEDLVQAGAMGLIKALNNFNRTLGNSFLTYAAVCIIGEIKHYVRREDSYYKPKSLDKLQHKVEDYITETIDRTGEAPTVEDISQTANIKEEGLYDVMRAGLVPYDDLDLSKVSSLYLESFKLPLEDKIHLSNAFNKLNEIQKKVIYLLFYMDLTQTEVAKRLGIQQRQVSRIKDKSLAELKRNMQVQNEKENNM